MTGSEYMYQNLAGEAQREAAFWRMQCEALEKALKAIGCDYCSMMDRDTVTDAIEFHKKAVEAFGKENGK